MDWPFYIVLSKTVGNWNKVFNIFSKNFPVCCPEKRSGRVLSESRYVKQKSDTTVWRKREENKWDGNVPDIAAEEFNGGHDFKTSLMAGFENE